MIYGCINSRYALPVSAIATAEGYTMVVQASLDKLRTGKPVPTLETSEPQNT